eukprot:5680910-Pleurochrysis_carterae.AAC.1
MPECTLVWRNRIARETEGTSPAASNVGELNLCWDVCRNYKKEQNDLAPAWRRTIPLVVCLRTTSVPPKSPKRARREVSAQSNAAVRAQTSRRHDPQWWVGGPLRKSIEEGKAWGITSLTTEI